MTTIPRYVLDAFALLAYFQAEPGAVGVRALIHRLQAGEVVLTMTAVNLGEVVYRTLRVYGQERAADVLARIREYGIEIVDVDHELALAAAHVKASYRIGYADCMVVALAQRLNATVVTGDPDFQQVAGLVTIEWLPQR